ncbi:MAG: transcriptional antiterminator, partial [Clostridiales bacterium]|nr:transcriptional antiterminator [Clostridiales bacterium]
NKESFKEKETVYTIAKKLLEKYVKYVNPEMAISSIKEFIEALHLDFNDNKKENLIDLIVHLGCMLNRCIHGDEVKFADIEEFKEKNSKGFRKIKGSIKKMEDEYEVNINDDEICYILTILNIYDINN